MIHILVVEDDEKLNRFVCTYLGKSGFLTKGCLNAQEAYQELFSKPCDLIISDMPKMTSLPSRKVLISVLTIIL